MSGVDTSPEAVARVARLRGGIASRTLRAVADERDTAVEMLAEAGAFLLLAFDPHTGQCMGRHPDRVCYCGVRDFLTRYESLATQNSETLTPEQLNPSPTRAP